jgi:hypothetical protein
VRALAFLPAGHTLTPTTPGIYYLAISRNTFKENEIAGNSGSIILNATNGNVNLGNLNSSADFAEGGNITVNATGDITSVGGRSINISSLSNEANAGTISFNSSQGNINLTNSSPHVSISADGDGTFD